MSVETPELPALVNNKCAVSKFCQGCTTGREKLSLLAIIAIIEKDPPIHCCHQSI